MDFHTIEFEEDLDELEADELRDLVTDFAEAQAANLEQFEETSERVAGLEEYDAEISEKLVDESPLSETEVGAIDFARKRELLEEFAAEEETEEPEEEFDEGDEGDEGRPEQFGQQGPTHDGEGEDGGTPEFVEKAFEDTAGVQL